MAIELIRSFIAIELPPEVKSDLDSLQKMLITKQQDWIKWVSPESMHITLKFLGDVASDKIDEIKMGIEESSVGIPPFNLQIKGLGVFPNLKRMQIIWVGIAGDISYLKQIQKNIENNLSILGYPAENREFTPHLTLGRIRYSIPPLDQQKLAQLIEGYNFTSSHEIQVNSINLMKSQLTPRGPIYTRMGIIPLK
jgi:RNA 2',3'-cyclic 3'-phosphodiesterase